MKQDIFQAALEIQEFFTENGWDFAIIGGLAVIRWGQPRTTIDVDGTLLTLFTDEEHYVDTILAHFKPRYDGAREFALQNRVLLLTSSNGIGLDFSLGGLPFEQQLVQRSSLYEYAKGCVLRTCSAEDLIVCKAFAAREQDWADVKTVLQRQQGKLDIHYVNKNLEILSALKEAPELVTKLNDMIEEVNA